MYPVELTAPMAKELNKYGFRSLTTAEEVDEVLGKKEGSVLVVVNSVCGCAAANARPGAIMSLGGEKQPDEFVDREATARAREYMLPYPPSSPSIALFKDGKLVHFLERFNIEGRPAEAIAQNLVEAYNRL